MATTPWKPSSFLGLPEGIKRKYLAGYRGRFASKSQLPKKLAEGWEVVQFSPEDMKLLKPATIIDGKALTTSLEVRELILIRMPEDVAKSRDDFFKGLTDDALNTTVEKFKKETDVEGHGNRATGKIEINVGGKNG